MGVLLWIVIGGALFFMLAEALEATSPRLPLISVAAGFSAFFALEQFLHRHHCHAGSAECRRPLTYLILAGDALHNLLDGVAVAAASLADPRLGLATWVAVAAHEIPQEIGDFAVLLHGGWSKGLLSVSERGDLPRARRGSFGGGARR